MEKRRAFARTTLSKRFPVKNVANSWNNEKRKKMYKKMMLFKSRVNPFLIEKCQIVFTDFHFSFSQLFLLLCILSHMP